ncbi:hypothetical protein LTR37_008176 [Vermiconidia calcicola]|uniref:Uncharacterized protein n=1 Tax=Vermiconidia calcicola TaxID=1690605 RepID=A0ACC3NCZ2_9PEZI|nr:hypothetical protein LTR37_008176 [Vermiconidia calcicola]
MVRASRSDVSFAKTTLPYPIFTADFDPYNRGYLVVAGGGGESRSGVPNQISVLDVSDRASITTAVDIELTRDEDSVQSVANLATRDGLIVFAGINSSEADQNAGKNEHFRSFDVKYPPRKKQKTEESEKGAEKGQWKSIGKRSLFRPSTAAKKETYQRILRLSLSQKRESGSRRIGAIATGLARDSQVIVFNATNATPDASDILTSIDLPERAEAADLDIIESAESEFSVSYCTDYDIYEQSYKYDFRTKKTEKTPRGPRRVHRMPDSESATSKASFRCLRFLNAQNVVALVNKPNKSGAELRVFHLYPTGPAIQIRSHKLPSRIKQASSLDVCALDADKKGNQQFAIAVAGQDISIEVFTTNFQPATDTFSAFRSYITLRGVHEHQMTKVCFSPFHTPAEPSAEKKTTPQQQFVRLASVSYGNSVVVDTFPLTPLEPADKKSRYVLSHPGDEKFAKWAYIVIISMVVLVTAFLLQSFGTGGFSTDTTGPFSFLPSNMRSFLDQPAYSHATTSLGTTPIQAHPTAIGRLQSRISNHNIPTASSDNKQKALLVRAPPHEGQGGVTVDIHPDKEAYRAKDSEAKHWHELSEEQKVRWMGRLKQAGEWAEAEGEKVLWGVLFSEYAGLVGEGVRGFVGEL